MKHVPYGRYKQQLHTASMHVATKIDWALCFSIQHFLKREKRNAFKKEGIIYSFAL